MRQGPDFWTPLLSGQVYLLEPVLIRPKALQERGSLCFWRPALIWKRPAERTFS